LLGINPKERKIGSQRVCTPVFTAVLSTIAKIWKQPKCPSTEEWLRKMGYVHTHNRIPFSHEKEGNPAICDNMDRLRLEHYAKPDSQIEKDKYCMVSLIRGI
ncbi:LORF2 protein, partial [Crocuta crocuta]